MLSEADTCRRFVVPSLQAAGWDEEPHSIAEQRTITDGRIVPVGQGFVRRAPRRVDYLLRYERNFPLAVVEAKATDPRSSNSTRSPDWRLPSRHAEQHRIVGELDTLAAALDRLRDLQCETAAELNPLLPAVLDRAFRGELI